LSEVVHSNNGDAMPDRSQRPRVESRVTVSAPTRTIQVQQVRISEHHRSSVALAIRAGRARRSSG
jgi:hypothetical protein